MSVTDSIVVRNIDWYDDVNILQDLLDTAKQRYDNQDPEFMDGPKMNIIITVEKQG
jgi:hypothetical protein